VLHKLRKRRKARRAVDGNLDTYLQRILAAMSPMAAPSMSKEDLLQQEGLEQLTGSEMQILHLLDMDLTNKEIARELVVTVAAVERHVTSIFDKLGLHQSPDQHRRVLAVLKFLRA